jgi:hypothetical protein
MRRTLAYAICIVGMFGVYEAAKAIVGVGGHFGIGFFAGMMAMAVLFWLAERTQKSRY